MKNLNEKEIADVNGGIAFNIVGGLAGAVGGFYGSIISGGHNASAWDIASGTIAGAAVGFINPVRGIGGAVASAGGGVLAGAVTSVMDDIKFHAMGDN